MLHGRWNPVDDRFRDYISLPKYNMYRSLHTAVLVGGEPVGVLIRTSAMDAVATFLNLPPAQGAGEAVVVPAAGHSSLDVLAYL